MSAIIATTSVIRRESQQEYNVQDPVVRPVL